MDPFDEDEVTRVTVSLDELGTDVPDASIPDLDDSSDDLDSAPAEPVARTHPYVADTGAEEDAPTLESESFLVSAAAQTDPGQRRKQNEDRYLADENNGLFCVADGMGGYAGGEIAAQLAVETIQGAFRTGRFEADVRADLPQRTLELVKAVQMANLAIYQRAKDEPQLQGMGTTLVAARFALRKERLYIGHVGDSRCYRLRDGELKLLTTDHTLRSLGAEGPGSSQLVRALGIGTRLDVDIISAEPRVGDVYLLCSDGLSKSLEQETIRSAIAGQDLDRAAERLVELSNERGGQDNITAVLVGVQAAPGAE
jgi:protein phosphatase